MKAVRIHAFGEADELRYEDVDEPRLISSQDVIVRLKTAALNHIDLWNRRGLTGMDVKLPHILGADGAGVVAEVGAEVKNVKPGDEVCLYPPTGCGSCEFCLSDREFMCVRARVLGERIEGTYAEYVSVPAKNCFPIPAGLSFEEAAAFPLVFLTVWRMVVTNGQLKAGEHVLILGIGGGVATAALQIAKHMGAHVIVTSSSDAKLELARNWGADHGINHTKKDFAQEVRALTKKRGVDMVVDSVGGESWPKSLASLAKGGRLVTCGATAGANPPTDLRRVFWNQLKIFGSTLGSREDFRQLLAFMNSARVRPILDQIFPLAEAAAAHRRLEERKQFGKIVLQIAS
ncbi:MAG TPA: zinc-binding dehydrogenase [Candidatus Acidoferrales bacterium]|nr:zinc-binding dehydrogenase [Candidatus Acidoferrales bacterium]